jgi:hypothetical protein
LYTSAQELERNTESGMNWSQIRPEGAIFRSLPFPNSFLRGIIKVVSGQWLVELP